FEVGPDYPAARRRTRTAGRKWLALKPVRHRPMPPACPFKNKVLLMKKAVFAILLSTAAIVAGPVACSKGDKAEATYTVGTELGISKAAMDTGVKPGDDFYAYANGNWDRTTEIPADRSSIGAFYIAFLETEKRVRELVGA